VGVSLKSKHLYGFGAYRLDTLERVLLRDGHPVTLPPKDLETLLALVERAGHIVEKRELLEKVWPGVFVEEGNLARHIFNLRHVLGDARDGRKYIETIPKRGYRFVAAVTKLDPPEISQIETQADQPLEPLPRQEIRFCVTGDGVRIAWASVGSGYPLLKAANWLNHLEYERESPVWRHWITELTKYHRFVRYDERGNGLSDWEVKEISLKAWVQDLETVVDAAGLERFALMGISQGGAPAITYAVRHPERVSHLILIGAYSRGWEYRENPEALNARHAFETLVRLDWGSKNPAFAFDFARLYMPQEATFEHQRWFNDLQHVSASPENAARIMEACDKIDVRALLRLVSVPTIVFHSDGDRAVPPEEGRILAAEIPNARFVPLPSANHLLLADELAWRVFLEHLGTFLRWQDRTPVAAIP